MKHYIYIFLKEGCSIYSPVSVECHWVNHVICLYPSGNEVYPGHVKVLSTDYDNNRLVIVTTNKRLDFKLEFPDNEIDVGYLITNVLGKITIRQVDPCEMLDKEKLIRVPSSKMQRIPLIKESESPSPLDKPMTISDGLVINILVWFIGMLCLAVTQVK